VLTAQDGILWNGTTVSPAQLDQLLRQSLRYPVEPELQLQPESDASYDLSAKVIAAIKRARVTKFGFVDNERFSAFDKAQ
jgi:biopolymer transport protein ExbD